MAQSWRVDRRDDKEGKEGRFIEFCALFSTSKEILGRRTDRFARSAKFCQLNSFEFLVREKYDVDVVSLVEKSIRGKILLSR